MSHPELVQITLLRVKLSYGADFTVLKYSLFV